MDDTVCFLPCPSAVAAMKGGALHPLWRMQLPQSIRLLVCRWGRIRGAFAGPGRCRKRRVGLPEIASLRKNDAYNEKNMKICGKYLKKCWIISDFSAIMKWASCRKSYVAFGIVHQPPECRAPRIKTIRNSIAGGDQT